ncbi:MAG: lipopolysaccharide transport periplasmic protein LptA [Psychromonas sp.]
MKINKISLIFAIMMCAFSAQSLESDYQQAINVSSVSQHVKMKSNTITFTTDVLLTQGSIKITANKLTVIRGEESNQEIMIAEGNTATFYQTQDDGRPLHAQANEIHYDVANSKITLTGNAQVRQLDSKINASNIIYFLETEELIVKSDQNGQHRVKTVFLPSQFEEQEQDKQQAEEK